jgi:hypothetical protein
MNIITLIRHKLGKLLWSENSWTKAVDEIEVAAKEIQDGEKDKVVFQWAFTFMKPPNRYWITIEKATGTLYQPNEFAKPEISA